MTKLGSRPMSRSVCALNLFLSGWKTSETAPTGSEETIALFWSTGWYDKVILQRVATLKGKDIQSTNLTGDGEVSFLLQFFFLFSCLPCSSPLTRAPSRKIQLQPHYKMIWGDLALEFPTWTDTSCNIEKQPKACVCIYVFLSASVWVTQCGTGAEVLPAQLSIEASRIFCSIPRPRQHFTQTRARTHTHTLEAWIRKWTLTPNTMPVSN